MIASINNLQEGAAQEERAVPVAQPPPAKAQAPAAAPAPTPAQANAPQSRARVSSARQQRKGRVRFVSRRLVFFHRWHLPFSFLSLCCMLLKGRSYCSSPIYFLGSLESAACSPRLFSSPRPSARARTWSRPSQQNRPPWRPRLPPPAKTTTQVSACSVLGTAGWSGVGEEKKEACKP